MIKTINIESEMIDKSLNNEMDEIDIPDFMKNRPRPIIYEQRKANIKAKRKTGLKLKKNILVALKVSSLIFILFILGQMESPDTPFISRLLTATIQGSFSYVIYRMFKDNWSEFKSEFKWMIFESWKEDEE